MKTWTTKSGYKVTRLLPFRGNAYLVETGTHNILVDTGSKSS
ncbi:MAG TPA: Zn-dependent hydrolase, partial [Rikenellaceae bacterium]|nr:Zn-dependent hydrolase [Rikenellaceae bacterium]